MKLKDIKDILLILLPQYFYFLPTTEFLFEALHTQNVTQME